MKCPSHTTHLFWWIHFIVAVLAPVSTQAQSIVLADGSATIAAKEQAVRDPIEIHRQPLFENAPFLRLRKGDTLVKAHSTFSDNQEYFLCSGGKYYWLSVEEALGELRVNGNHGEPCSMLFDWDFNLANANELRNLSDFPGYLIPPKLGEIILKRVQKNFPEALTKFQDWSLAPDKVVSIPGREYYEFHGLLPDEANSIYRYTLRIGPGIYEAFGEILIKGPPPVLNFSAKDERTRKQNQAADARYQKFAGMILKTSRAYFQSLPPTPTPPTPSLPFYVPQAIEYRDFNPEMQRDLEQLAKKLSTPDSTLWLKLPQLSNRTSAYYSTDTKTIWVSGNLMEHAEFWATVANTIANSKNATKARAEVETPRTDKPKKMAKKPQVK